MPSQTHVISTRIPTDWAVRLQERAAAEGCDTSKVVKDAIAKLLEIDTPESVESLQKRVSRLERQVKRLLAD